MQTNSNKSLRFMLLVFLLVFASNLSANEPTVLPISGLIGMTGGLESGWLAIKVEIPENEALSGILWYNNDHSVVFPHLLVGAGFEDSPGFASEAMAVVSGVSGASLQQCEVNFDQPVGASLGGLYVIFEFPEGQGFTSEGSGGGPGVGYFIGEEGSHGWISGDGENWMRLADDYRFSIVPLFVPFVEGMAIKSLEGEIEIQQEDEPVAAVYLNAAPNPFNPQVELKFGLPKSGNVELSIFNLRGERIVRLVDEHYAAGNHFVTWTGTNANGQKVASGVYFARFTTQEIALTQRLVLVK